MPSYWNQWEISMRSKLSGSNLTEILTEKNGIVYSQTKQAESEVRQ